MDLLKPSYASGYAKNASQSAHPNLWDGLVGAWMPSLGVTGETLRDVSGNGNHGTLTNMDAASDWVGTSKGLALDYTGGNQRVSGSIDPSVFAGAHTISCWFNRRATASWGAFFTNNSGSPNQASSFGFTSNTNRIGIHRVGVNATDISVDLGATHFNEWIFASLHISPS